MRRRVGKKPLETGGDEGSGIGAPAPFDHDDPVFDAVWRRLSSLVERVAEYYDVGIPHAREMLRKAGYNAN